MHALRQASLTGTDREEAEYGFVTKIIWFGRDQFAF